MQINIIGLGMNKGHISVEALKLLETSTHIICIEQREEFPYYEKYQDKIISLDYLFDEYSNRNEALENIGLTVYRLFKTLSNIVFALQGNPILSVSPVYKVMRYAKNEGIKCNIVSSGSSIDAFIADTGIDISNTGIQMISAKLIDKVTHHLPVLILNPGYSETVLAEDKFKILEKLSNKLRNIYGQEEFILFSSREIKSELIFLNIQHIPKFLEDKNLGKYMIVGPTKYMEEYL